MQNIDNSTKVKIYSVLAIFGILSLVIIGWWIWSDIYCGKLLLSIAPESSNITINGKKIQNGTHTMTPGKYKVEVSKDGFESASKEFEIKSGQKTNISLALAQNDPNGTWYNEHEKDDIIRSGAGYAKITETMKKLTEKHPIVKHLPYTNSTKTSLPTGFSITYNLDTKDKTEVKDISVRIFSKCNSSNYDFYKDLATNWLESKEKNIFKKYKVDFIDPTCSLH